MLLLAPFGAHISCLWNRQKVYYDREYYEIYLGEDQAIRGTDYLEDGAIHSSELVWGAIWVDRIAREIRDSPMVAGAAPASAVRHRHAMLPASMYATASGVTGTERSAGDWSA
jgi:hypothetical protein